MKKENSSHCQKLKKYNSVFYLKKLTIKNNIITKYIYKIKKRKTKTTCVTKKHSSISPVTFGHFSGNTQ